MLHTHVRAQGGVLRFCLRRLCVSVPVCLCFCVSVCLCACLLRCRVCVRLEALPPSETWVSCPAPTRRGEHQSGANLDPLPVAGPHLPRPVGAGGLKVASMVAQAPAPGPKYLGDQEASLGQELVGRVGGKQCWGKATLGSERPPPMLSFLGAVSQMFSLTLHAGEIHNHS